MHETSARWLEGRRDDLWNNRPISSTTLDRLGTCFTHASVVMHLGEFFLPIGNGVAVPAVGSVTSADIREWLRDDTAINREQLTNDPSMIEQAWGLDPWSVIDRWMAVECLLRARGEPSPTPATAYADAVFQRIVTDAGRNRNVNVQDASSRRWDKTVALLPAWIRTVLLTRSTWTPNDMGRSLADLLWPECRPSMNGKVRFKHQHFDGHVRNQYPFQVSREWIGRLSARALAANARGSALPLTTEDIDSLRKLVNWVASIGSPRAAAGCSTLLPGIQAAGAVAAQNVPGFLVAWNALAATASAWLRTQIGGIPRAAFYVGDIIRVALPAPGSGSPNFPAWIIAAASWGLLPVLF